MDQKREYTRQRRLHVEGQSAQEYSLPDYQGDVKKILLQSAELMDGGRFQNGDSLDCIGSVIYKLVYLDSEGRITPVTFSSDYEMS